MWMERLLAMLFITILCWYQYLFNFNLYTVQNWKFEFSMISIAVVVIEIDGYQNQPMKRPLSEVLALLLNSKNFTFEACVALLLLNRSRELLPRNKPSNIDISELVVQNWDFGSY